MAKSLIAGLVTLCLALCILCATAEENLIPWEYEVPLKDLQSGYLTVNNKERLLDENTDDPVDLVRLTVQCTSSSAVLLRQSAGDALGRMFTVARRQGIELYANSGFRNYTTQKTMYRNRMERLGRDDGVVAYPGSCDNQTGLGVDVISKEWIGKQVDETFAETPEAKWMAENCWKYGFVIRYPADKTELTFSGYQPWHLRYVGRNVAAYMHKKNYCLEEFDAEWQAELAEFVEAGGDIEKTIAASILPDGEIELLNEVGPDGDFEVSLYR